MNKTIIINISGIVFHIEEDAYEVLRNYMIAVKKHFGLSPESHEIIIDIENRIAEMFSELLVEGKKEVITLEDVHMVMEKMGSVADFENAENETEERFSESFDRPFKKLMRDMDDKVVGGVASGLGHYFGIQAQWVRIIFLLLVIFGGTGFLLYCILWIVIPKARSRADRMSMKGEPINLHTFQKNFQDEMEGLKHTFRNTRNETSGVFDSIIKIIGTLARVFIKIIAVIFISALCIGLVLLTISIFATFEFFGDGHDLSMFPINIFEPSIQNQFLISLLVVVSIPLIALIAGIFKIIFNRTLINQYFGFTLLVVWLIGVGFSTVYATRTLKDFKDESKLVEEKSLIPHPIYTLKINDIKTIEISNDTMSNRENTISQSIKTREHLTYHQTNTARIRIIQIDSLQAPTIGIEYAAKGKSYEEATRRVERIKYTVKQEGENLFFDSHPMLPEKEVFRDQKVIVTIKIPVGTRLKIEDNLRRGYFNNLPFRQCQENFETLFETKSNYTEWYMSNHGLKCAFELPQD